MTLPQVLGWPARSIEASALQHHVLGLAAYAMGVERKWGADRTAEIKLVNWPTAQVVLPKAPWRVIQSGSCEPTWRSMMPATNQGLDNRMLVEMRQQASLLRLGNI